VLSFHAGARNSAGVLVVYASEHLAMAAQERFVHLPRPLPHSSRFVKFRLNFGRLAITRMLESNLPPDWRTEPLSVSTQAMGDGWVASASSAILAVPSVLIPEETNFVLNPGHPDFARIEISPAEPFAFDPRLIQRIEPAQRGRTLRP